jgi:hypothetical protein
LVFGIKLSTSLSSTACKTFPPPVLAHIDVRQGHAIIDSSGVHSPIHLLQYHVLVDAPWDHALTDLPPVLAHIDVRQDHAPIDLRRNHAFVNPPEEWGHAFIDHPREETKEGRVIIIENCF